MDNKPVPRVFKNHFVWWGLAIPTVLGVVLTAAAILLHTGFLRNDVNADIVAVAFIFVITVVGSNLLIKFLGHRLNRQYMSHFHLDASTFSFTETRSIIKIKNHNHQIVLLFHGFGASTQDFKGLTAYFDKHEIAYYAPNITGFGLINTKLLFEVKDKDWFRIAVESYDLVSQIADKVSIVGQSLGCILAAHVASHRPVEHLIMSAPCFHSCKSDWLYKKILLSPIISRPFRTLIPMLPKLTRKNRISPSDTLDAAAVQEIFQYIALPINSILQLFLAQNHVDIKKANARTISVFYGKYDLTVDMDKLFALLDNAKISYNKIFCENSAHNLLQDYEREFVCKTITQILLNDPVPVRAQTSS